MDNKPPKRQIQHPKPHHLSQFGISVDDKFRAKLEAIAEAERRSLSNLSVVLIEEALAAREQNAGGTK